MRPKGLTGYQITHEEIAPDVHVIALGGELDMRASPELKRAFDQLLEDEVSLLVVDLADATFIDSSAIGAIVAAFRRLSEEGGSLRLACSEPNLLRVFELTGLDHLFPIHPDRRDALGVFAGAHA
jgi:anti-sigma B factor antagonist